MSRSSLVESSKHRKNQELKEIFEGVLKNYQPSLKSMVVPQRIAGGCGTCWRPDDNHVYYNMTINNNGTQPIPANFTDFRTEAIIDKPEDYHLSIIRFSIPGALIPLFVWPGDNQFSVTISYGGSNFQTFLLLTQHDNVVGQTNYIYSYQHMVDMINTAFSTSWGNLQATFPIFGPYFAPQLTYDPFTGLFSLYVQTIFSIDSLSNPLSIVGPLIYMNSNLYDFFQSFNVIYNGNNLPYGLDYQFIVENTLNNLVNIPISAQAWSSTHAYSTDDIVYYNGNYYISLTNGNTGNNPATSTANWASFILPGFKITNEFNCLAFFNDLQTIVFTTGQMPVKQESISTATSDLITTSASPGRNIITDFEVTTNPGEPNARGIINFFNQGEYRLTDMKGKTALNIIDVQVFWQNKALQIFPLMISPGDNVTAKIMFRKKTYKEGL